MEHEYDEKNLRTGPADGADRRAILGTGLALVAGLVIPGCVSRRGASNAALPGPVWPGQRVAPTPATPAPQIRTRSASSGSTIAVMPRSTWTAARPIVAQTNPMVRVERITVHHDGMAPVELRTKSDVADRIEVIRRSHVEGRGWADIGYHLIVDPHGRVWQGRPVELQGAHVKDHNERNLGVLVLGNFEHQYPTPQATHTLDRLLTEKASTYRVPLRWIKTHQEWASTACPGQHLQAYMVGTRSRGGRLYSTLTRS